MLWSEKYRPRFKIVPPHHNLLLHGPPGTGKTTYALQLSPDIELNASSHRGIETIRNLPTNKYILLDECDYLTSDAQNCLRRIMEKGKFILCANYLSKLSLPIRSRAQAIKFNKERMKQHLIQIIRKENLVVDHEMLWKECDMDIRRCLNVLQSYKALSTDSFASDEDNVDIARIENIEHSGTELKPSMKHGPDVKSSNKHETDVKLLKKHETGVKSDSTSFEHIDLEDITLSDDDIVPLSEPSHTNTTLLNYLLGHISEEMILSFLEIKSEQIPEFVKKFIDTAQIITKLIQRLAELLIGGADRIIYTFQSRQARMALAYILSQAEELVTQGVDSELILYMMVSGWCMARDQNEK